MARKCFFSFHYIPDNWRASQVRNIGTVEGNSPASDNDWETVKGGGDTAIKNWIGNQMNGRTCAIILAGQQTANRKWINYEISKAWNDGLGVVAIRIHGLKNSSGNIATMGNNPLDYVTFDSGTKLSSVAKCYNPQGTNSQARYHWIKKHLSNAVEEAIEIRNKN